MMHDNPNLNRRKLLIATSLGAGGVGLASTAVSLVESMMPSEAAKAAGAPTEADISRIAPGQLQTVEWRGRPVWILHRTDEMLSALRGNDALLADPQSIKSSQPQYATNPGRARNPRYFVAIGICTHLGCIPTLRPDAGAAGLGKDWPGGFYCPCHGSKFDLAGRVFKNVPAPLNLEIPRYQYLSETRLRIGTDSDAGDDS